MKNRNLLQMLKKQSKAITKHTPQLVPREMVRWFICKCIVHLFSVDVTRCCAVHLASMKCGCGALGALTKVHLFVNNGVRSAKAYKQLSESLFVRIHLVALVSMANIFLFSVFVDDLNWSFHISNTEFRQK